MSRLLVTKSEDRNARAGAVGELTTNTVVALCESQDVKLGVLSLVNYRALCREYPTLELKLKRGYTQHLFSRSHLKNHFFLSHYQANGGNTVKSLYEKLRQVHIKCWLDNQQNDRSERGMMVGIKHSAVLLLFLVRTSVPPRWCGPRQLTPWLVRISADKRSDGAGICPKGTQTGISLEEAHHARCRDRQPLW